MTGFVVLLVLIIFVFVVYFYVTYHFEGLMAEREHKNNLINYIHHCFFVNSTLTMVLLTSLKLTF